MNCCCTMLPDTSVPQAVSMFLHTPQHLSGGRAPHAAGRSAQQQQQHVAPVSRGSGRGRRAGEQASFAAASMAGGRGGFGQDSPLIMGPNGSPMGRNAGPPGAPGRLIIPGQAPGGFGAGRQQQGQGRPGIGLDGVEGGSGPGQLPPAHKYRPPPGFMNADAQDPALNQADPQEMISKLRSRAGQWHQLAKHLPVLYAKGFDTNTVAELTGVNPVDQNTWVVAGTVYDSIKATGQVRACTLGRGSSGTRRGRTPACAAVLCAGAAARSGVRRRGGGGSDGRSGSDAPAAMARQRQHRPQPLQLWRRLCTQHQHQQRHVLR
jgi:hypothetical protein